MVSVQGWKNVSIINNGSKILTVKYGNLKFIDSLNFFAAPLSKLPKMMCIEGNVAKGYFPHLFNTLDNQQYVGCLPAKKVYCPDDMNSSEREVFLKWYDEKIKENYEFDFQREIEFYCRLDVEILAKACLKFRKLFLDETGVDPFSSITVVASCMKTFQKNFLQTDSIGIIPRNGYRMIDNQSISALSWLEWVASEKKLKIQHAGNGPEVKPPGLNFKEDGFCANSNIILEFHGCYWHGCKRCFPTGRDIPLQNARNYEL